MLLAQAFPEVLVPHRLIVVCPPMGVDTVPSLTLELVIADRADAGPFGRHAVFAAEAIMFHGRSPFNTPIAHALQAGG